jgi:hypothetical protein
MRPKLLAELQPAGLGVHVGSDVQALATARALDWPSQRDGYQPKTSREGQAPKEHFWCLKCEEADKPD